MLMCASITMFAEEHLKFKGVELNGPLQEFVNQMKAQGFSFKEEFSNGAIMEGTFMGYSDCELFITITPNSKIVRSVRVYLPEEKDSWYSLKSVYTKSVDAFTNKYGKPTNQYSFFSKPYYEGDGYEMTGVKNDKCNYISFWEVEKGTMAVEITKFCQVCIGYEDKVNTDLMRQEKNQNTYNDI